MLINRFLKVARKKYEKHNRQIVLNFDVSRSAEWGVLCSSRRALQMSVRSLRLASIQPRTSPFEFLGCPGGFRHHGECQGGVRHIDTPPQPSIPSRKPASSRKRRVHVTRQVHQHSLRPFDTAECRLVPQEFFSDPGQSMNALSRNMMPLFILSIF